MTGRHRSRRVERARRRVLDTLAAARAYLVLPAILLFLWLSVRVAEGTPIDYMVWLASMFLLVFLLLPVSEYPLDDGDHTRPTDLKDHP